MTSLRAFEAVARLKEFKSAAAELNVTPSAISHQVRQLEQEIGCRLVVRGRRGCELTAEGRSLSEAVRRSFRRIGDAVSSLRDLGRRRVRFQVYSTFAVRWLLPRLPRFEQAHPELEVSLITSQTDVDLRSSEIDACVMIGTPQDDNVEYTYLFNSEVYPVCSPEYAARKPSLKTPSDLSNHTLLQVYPSEDDWSVWLNAVGAGDVDASGNSRFDSYDHALNSAVRGLGVALAIEPFATEDLTAGRLIELFVGCRVPLPKSWYFASLAEWRDEPKIAILREWIVAEIGLAKIGERRM